MSRKESHNRRWLMGSAATGLAMLMAAAPAMAQDDEADDDVVVVRGLKSSIQQSIATKADSTSIVEAVTAEDIGKLPDVSIAESLARLPGLAAQRLRGRAQVISVRGLGPDFTTATLNGREQVTAGDNRGVEFDQFPAELLSGVVVYKTPEASLIASGLAGTADLQTIRPLDFGQRAVSVGARYEWNEQDALNAGTENDGYRFTASYIDQFADGTVGLVLGFATQSTPTQSQRYESWGFPTTNVDGTDAFVLGGVKPYSESRDLERDAFLGTLQWEPSDTFSTTLDVFYSEFEDTGVLRGVEIPLLWGGYPLSNAVVEDGNVVSGTFSGVQGVLRNDNRFRSAELFSFGWNGQWQATDNWMIEADYSRSKVDRLDTDLETYAGTGAGNGNGASDDLDFALNSDGVPFFMGSLDYSDPSLFLLTDPQGWGQVGFIKRPETEDELDAIRLSATRSFNDTWIDSVEVGVNFTTREKNKVSNEEFLRGFAGTTDTAVPVPSSYLLSSASDFGWIGIGEILSYDSLGLYNDGFFSTEVLANPDVVTKAWQVEEDVTTWYAQLNMRTEWGGVPVRGNFGVQYVETDQSSSGQAIGFDGSTGMDIAVPFTAGDKYSQILPSVNLSFEVAPDTFIRAAYAKTQARARMDDLRGSRAVNFNNMICGFEADGVTPFYTPENANNPNDTCLSSSGGDPMLRPYLADSYDVSFEYYFADRAGYVSIAAFYKELEDFIFPNFSRPFDFTNEANAIFGSDFVAMNPGIETGTTSTPTNIQGGNMQGIELSTNIPGEAFLPSPLDGFGLYASYSITDSEISNPLTNSPEQIPGLSEDVANVTLYYEKGGFQARVSQRYRSEFLGEVTGFGAGLERRNVESEKVVDAQIGYSFEDTGTRLDGISILLQGQNITDEEFVTTDAASGLPKNFETYGATYLLGINWRM